MTLLKKISILSVLMLSSIALLGQKKKPLNLPNFDDRPYHWGFILAYTQSSFYIDREPEFDFSDSLFYIDPESVGAFAVGPLASLDITPNIHLRTGIVLTFQDRNINYGFWLNDTLEVFKKKVHSVYTEVPLMLKLRTNRINNYALYATGGIKYGYDWASQINVKESFNYKDIVKIQRGNFAYGVGGGIDFFLPYFKFGIDLRLDIGINNVNVKNGTYFSNPIQKMRTQMWQLSFTFEG